jgi:hypothetical protein
VERTTLSRLRLSIGYASARGRYPEGVVAAGVGVILVAFVWLVFRGAPWLAGDGLRGLTPEQRETAVDAVRGRILQIAAGAVAVGALVYTALSFRLSRESHVTDRYTKAIEQLGSEQLDVRLGAIYALERIMIDSVRDHPTIVEVLAAFIREHTDTKRFEDNNPPKKPATDVQAALTALGRRPRGREERPGGIDLRRTFLRGANLRHSCFNEAHFDDADLSEAELFDTQLVEADLTGARLTGAWLLNTVMSRARLINADLTSAQIACADLTGAFLRNADLTDASIGNTLLTDEQRAEATGLPDGRV